MDNAILELKDLLTDIRGHLYFELDSEINRNISVNEPRLNRPERRAGISDVEMTRIPIIEDLIARIQVKLNTF